MLGSATYPFVSAAPAINYHAIWVFTVQEQGKVLISLYAEHDIFPDYEGLLDGATVYPYTSPFEGPGLFNLALGPGVTFFGTWTIDADTPAWCCSKKE